MIHLMANRRDDEQLESDFSLLLYHPYYRYFTPDVWTPIVLAVTNEFFSSVPDSILHSRITHTAREYQPWLLEEVIKSSNGRIDPVLFDGGYSPVMSLLTERNFAGVKLLADYGSDLHFPAYDQDFSAHQETPTSLALNGSHPFFEWRQILRSLEMDLDSFVQRETEHPRIQVLGWTQETLGMLFSIDYKPRRIRTRERCGCCQRDFRRSRLFSRNLTPVEIPWLKILENMRLQERWDGDLGVYDPLACNEGDPSCVSDAADQLEVEYNLRSYDETEWVCINCWQKAEARVKGGGISAIIKALDVLREESLDWMRSDNEGCDEEKSDDEDPPMLLKIDF